MMSSTKKGIIIFFIAIVAPTALNLLVPVFSFIGIDIHEDETAFGLFRNIFFAISVIWIFYALYLIIKPDYYSGSHITIHDDKPEHDQKHKYQYADSWGNHTQEESTPRETYGQLRRRLQIVIDEWMSAETFIGDQSDYIFLAPTLFDVTVPATAHWHNSRDEAINLLDVYGKNNDEFADKTIVEAVNEAITAWYNAVKFGKKSVGNQLYAKRKRIVSLTDMILYGSDEEAKVAMMKLHDILCEVTYEMNGTTNPLIPSKVSISNREHVLALSDTDHKAIER